MQAPAPVGNSKAPPPKPRKPSTTVNTNVPSPLSQNSPIMRSPTGKQTYGAAAKKRLNTAYNHLPAMPASLGGSHGRAANPSMEQARPSATRAMTTTNIKSSTESVRPQERTAPPPPPPRRNLSSYPAAAAQYASNRIGGAWGAEEASNMSNGAESGSGNNARPIDKKEEMWRKRWIRAKEMMDAKGVVLRAWRVGSDVEEICKRLVEQELRDVDQQDRDEIQRKQDEGRGSTKQNPERR